MGFSGAQLALFGQHVSSNAFRYLCFKCQQKVGSFLLEKEVKYTLGKYGKEENCILGATKVFPITEDFLPWQWDSIQVLVDVIPPSSSLCPWLVVLLPLPEILVLVIPMKPFQHTKMTENKSKLN